VSGLAPVPVLESVEVHLREVIDLPPVWPSAQVRTSWPFTADVTDPEVGAPGTVVTVTAAEVAETGDIPAAFVALTVNVGVAPEANPVTTIGEDDPVTAVPELGVTVKDVAAGERAGKENATETAPSTYDLLVPTSVPTTFIGASGSRKSLDAADLPPIFLFTAIYFLLFILNVYAVKSP
jgi:hypothetical protein